MSTIINLINGLDGYKTYIGIVMIVVGLFTGQAWLVTLGSGMTSVGLVAKLQKLIDAIKSLLDPVDQ